MPFIGRLTAAASSNSLGSNPDEHRAFLCVGELFVPGHHAAQYWRENWSEKEDGRWRLPLASSSSILFLSAAAAFPVSKINVTPV